MNTLNRFTILLSLFLVKTSLLFGQAPNLASAETFSVFTGVGAFTNTGNSIIMGDLGTNDGSFTGFPPGQYLGQLHVEDAVSTLVANDVNLLYGYLSTLSGSTIGVGMGSGQILTPGVYETGAAATLDGVLILDGLNMTDPVFIIKVGGAFSTSSAATVTLINGASSCNVFWQIGGMLTISGITDFKGTAVVNGAANLNGFCTVEGRILVTNGAINMASNSVSFCQLVLPVELVSFDASLNKVDKSVSLDWQTASEVNSDHFIIQKSIDGTTFKELGTISAKGNTQTMTQYSFVDTNLHEGITYYRLQQFDMDGSFNFSTIKSINFESKIVEVNIFPNPFTNAIRIEYFSPAPFEDLEFLLFNSAGKFISSSKLIDPITIIDDLDLYPGHYNYILRRANAIIKGGHLVSY